MIDKPKLQSVWVNEVYPRVLLFPTYTAMSICLALGLSNIKLSVNTNKNREKKVYEVGKEATHGYGI